MERRRDRASEMGAGNLGAQHGEFRGDGSGAEARQGQRLRCRSYRGEVPHGGEGIDEIGELGRELDSGTNRTVAVGADRASGAGREIGHGGPHRISA